MPPAAISPMTVVESLRGSAAGISASGTGSVWGRRSIAIGGHHRPPSEVATSCRAALNGGGM